VASSRSLEWVPGWEELAKAFSRVGLKLDHRAAPGTAGGCRVGGPCSRGWEVGGEEVGVAPL
jgi:hypothetical protein